MAKPMPMFGGKESYAEEMKEAKAIKSGKITPQQYAKAEGKEKTKPKQTSFAIGGAIPSFGRGAQQNAKQQMLAQRMGRFGSSPTPAPAMQSPNRMPGDEMSTGRMPPPPMPAAGRMGAAREYNGPSEDRSPGFMMRGTPQELQESFDRSRNSALTAQKTAMMEQAAASQRPGAAQSREQDMPMGPSAETAKIAQMRDEAIARQRQGPMGPPSLIGPVGQPSSGRLPTFPQPQNSQQFNAASANPMNQYNPGQRAPAFKKGGFIKSADGVASKGKTKAQQFSSGGRVSSRADGIATKGKTRGKMC